MNKAITFILALFFMTATACHGDSATRGNRPALADSIAHHRERIAAQEADTASRPGPAAGITPRQAFKTAYPDFIADIRGNEVVFTDGTIMLWDDMREKSFEQRLNEADIEDMFFSRYDDSNLPPAYLADAGRSRADALFKKMYGSTQDEVSRNLVNVSWMGRNIKFTSVNGAADSLRKVAAALERLPHLKKYLKCSGTYFWRNVRGANRLSAHSFGIAIDIAVPYSDYWLWRNPCASETSLIKYTNRIPAEIVAIFRKYGFIWGGAWYHYDTMHFEFRPEILNYAQNE